MRLSAELALDQRADADHTEIMTTDDAILWQKWERDGRLTPWLVHDLPRIAWIVESRTSELTDEERQIVREAVTRMQRALDQTTA
jgi:hypothetical protein